MLTGIATATAHPLGNFSVNHLSKISAGHGRFSVRYVLDVAEIPAFAIARERSAGGRMSTADLAAWAHSQAASLPSLLHVNVNAQPLPLEVDAATASARPGAGGLSTLYLVLAMHGARSVAPGDRFSYADDSYAGRLGWRDVVVAPAQEPTRELRVYPGALLGSPRNTTAVSGTVIEGGLRVSPSVAAAGIDNTVAVRSNALSDMLARTDGGVALALLTLLVAVGLGALHALEPGHGKTLMAVSLVGARASAGQAAILAGAVTVAHTAGVVALGAAILALGPAFVPEGVYKWIALASGVAVAVVAARALRAVIRPFVPLGHVHVHVHPHAHPHEHAHAHGADDHHHHHGEDGHSHAIPGKEPLRFGSALIAAMSGGIAPCPAAIVVLLAAIALHRTAFGLAVIVAFSFGLALTLTAIGFAVVRGAGWLGTRGAFAGLVRYAPVLSAAIMSLIASAMVGSALAAMGSGTPAVAAAALCVLAILGYASTSAIASRAVQTT